MVHEDEAEDARGPVYWRFLPLALVAAGLALAYAMGWHSYLTLEYLSASRAALKAAASQHLVLTLLAYMVTYSIAVTFSFPATWMLTVFGGFLFGWIAGGAAAAIGATVGATALFRAARSAFGDSLRKRVGSTIARLASGFERDAFGYLLALRLVPVIPFFVLNIAPAMFKVRVQAFIAATFLGILPGTFIYAFLGESVDEVLLAAQRAGRGVTAQDLVTPEITWALVALAAVAAIPPVVRLMRSTRRPAP
ncbi:MAG: VTT domain-containing protein [Devosia sp.]|nr:VTT domain-containing protein [Devosia sp.]